MERRNPRQIAQDNASLIVMIVAIIGLAMIGIVAGILIF